ncbi:MAG: ATP-binding cassette domain-containing protein, partial [Deltaproteobacteria bacterium]|nr:ATP-binding cassette domain-containing protein [Deltaproteobacteria bacterium]
CGKSTLLSAICGNLADVFVLSGDVSLNERTILALPMEKRRIGILFQDDLLFPHMNIAENLAFALPSEMEKPEKKEKIREALMKAGLSGFEKRDPETLSGGQRARVSLLRSLLAEPEAILLDEPFSKLDQELKDQIRSFVFETIRSMDIPALLVSHDHRDCPQGQIINLANQGE